MQFNKGNITYQEATKQLREVGNINNINPFPYIKVIFSTLAKVGIQQGERGIVYAVITDTTSTEKYTTLKSVADIDTTKWTVDNVALLTTAFEGFPPSKLIVVRKGTDAIGSILKELEQKKLTDLCLPEATAEDDNLVVAWIKTMEEKKGIRYVSTYANNTDCSHVIELANTMIKHKLITNYTPQMFTLLLTSSIAGTPTNRSLDNQAFSTITDVDYVEPTNGRFNLYSDDGVIKVNLAINSRITFDSTWKVETRYIKIVDGIDRVRFDIQDTFKDFWLGRYINDYANKVQFCAIVNNSYFVDLTPNVLSADYDNEIYIDVEGNKQYIVQDGLDPSEMTETEIKLYPTGSKVFLAGSVRFANTMIDLKLDMDY